MARAKRDDDPRQLRLPYASSHIAATKEYWERELERSGLRDLESDGGMLTSDPVADRRRHDSDEAAAAREYYRAAASYLRATRFQWRVERVIWAAHAEGQTMRQIVATARATRMACVHLRYVHDVVTRHRAIVLDMVRKGKL
jgi:hypothetical protein